MRRIRDAVNADESRFPGRIAELEVHDMGAMRNNPEIHDALADIRRRRHSGWQYYPLSSYIQQQGLDGIELTAQKYDSLSVILDGMLEPFETPFGASYRISGKHQGTPEHTVFSRFTFPIIDVSKREMHTQAAEHGFLPLMEETWFCHSPLKDGSQCGTCTPCIVSIRGGMGYRVPLKTRLRYRTRTPRRLFWAIRKKLRRTFG
ncbi:Queuosine biosynthesis protein QueC [Aquisalimonas asiatica]|uniref:Queuosine biosynthesis protein QueC n=2 Tax=Aquisalimonas asiatica TaxID=406100 RepID=A0A1H8U5D7_9GAMM|nr:Queuosine biosynthesis protein QueC [Aquisalimonas asiatica]